MESLKEKDLLWIPHPSIPIEMINSQVKQKGDWIPWNTMESKVTDYDISELEKKINSKFPKSYKDFLKYKHFYRLERLNGIEFYPHCPRDWKNNLETQYFEYGEPEMIIEKGYIPFAHYEDGGVACLDTNKMSENDCPIVFVYYDSLYDSHVEFEILYDSFKSMIQNFLIELNN